MDARLLNTIMNLNQLFTNLYELKFKGRKILEQMVDRLYEKQLIEKNINKASTRAVYECALNNANAAIGGLMAKFQDEWLTIYKSQVEKIRLNLTYMATCRVPQSQQLNSSQLLVLEVVQLAKDISEGYLQQQKLVNKQWEEQCTVLLSSERQNHELKEMLLHIGFETHLDNKIQDNWKVKLSAFSNQRYNPKKN